MWTNAGLPTLKVVLHAAVVQRCLCANSSAEAVCRLRYVLSSVEPQDLIMCLRNSLDLHLQLAVLGNRAALQTQFVTRNSLSLMRMMFLCRRTSRYFCDIWILRYFTSEFLFLSKVCLSHILRWFLWPPPPPHMAMNMLLNDSLFSLCSDCQRLHPLVWCAGWRGWQVPLRACLSKVGAAHTHRNSHTCRHLHDTYMLRDSEGWGGAEAIPSLKEPFSRESVKTDRMLIDVDYEGIKTVDESILAG